MAEAIPSRYSTNQFYNFSNYESGAAPTNIGTTDNPAFIWPASHSKNGVTGNATPLQRGYIRMLAEAYGVDDSSKKLAARRFHFQFNPDVLTRQVEARNDVQLWMNQDPAQFVNPIPGNANFAFDFIINREAEVASRSYRTSYQGSTRKVTTNTILPGDSVTPPSVPTGVIGNVSRGVQQGVYSQSSVVDIGVLADLHVFDQIIGQGLNAEVLNKYTKKVVGLSNAYNEKVTAGAGGNESTADSEDTVPEAETIKVPELETFLYGNINNGAFLVSQPVRIVFSSLFMVEGFISSSTVTFNKFNPAMVPTQCTVSVTMTAMYIGFATKNTFLTNSLRAVIGDANDTTNANNESVAERSQLTQLGNDLFWRVEKSGDGPTVKRLLEKTNDSTITWEVNFYSSEVLLDYIRRGFVNGVNATATLRIVYKGVNGVKTVGTAFDVGETVYEVSSAVTEVVKNNSPKNTAKFLIEKKASSITQNWDENSDAKYEVVADIRFSLNTNIQEFETTQYASLKKIVSYNQTFSGDDLSLSKGPSGGGPSVRIL